MQKFVLLSVYFFSLALAPVVQAIPFEGSQLVISAPSHYAVTAGQQVAEQGGNVVDVAVTVGLTLAVTSPYYAALGGGGFALVKTDGPVEALDFREVAPLATNPQFYVKKAKNASVDGALAVGVPGVPAGLFELHKKHGHLPWKKLLTTPMRLAQNGFRVSGEWVRITNDTKERFNAAGKRIFFKKNGDSYKPGEIFKQPELAKVLRALQAGNTNFFYKGEAARDIATTLKKAGGVLTEKDLANYKPRWLTPMTVDFRGHQVYLMPPPSSGGVVIQTALQLIDKVKLADKPTLSVDELHTIAEVLSRSFRGRSLLGDPAFHENPLPYLLSDQYISGLAKTIAHKTQKLDPLSDPPAEGLQTTHFSVLDKNGQGVALTVTLNGNYGSAMVSEKFGIALNNEMDDFTTRPGEPNMFGLIQGKGNYVQPGKRPLSSMSPTLVLKDNKTILSVGAPGGPRIISAVFQALYRVLVSGLDMDQAIQLGRVHHQFLPHQLVIDANRLPPETLEGLKQRGHEIKEAPVARLFGVRMNAKGILEGAFDSRGEGAAGGL